MNALTLYFCPLTCARVTMIALEHIGAAYDVKLINLMGGMQHSPEYLAINPMGKVPALQIGEQVLTENAAILLYLDEQFPDAGLLPSRADPVAKAIFRADVIWCGTTLHPLVRQVRAPYHYTVGDTTEVQAKGIAGATALLERFELRFSESDWWFGSDWSIVDSYVAWALSGWEGAIDMQPYPALAAHGERAKAHPAFRAMHDREGALIDAAGMKLPPGMSR